MFPLLKLLLAVLYLSVFTVALPQNHPNQHQSSLSSSSNPRSGKSGACKEDQLLCADICYDPTEAECDPEFLTLTKINDQISSLKKEEAEKKKEKTKGDPQPTKRGTARRMEGRNPSAPPPPTGQIPNKRSAVGKVRYVNVDIPLPS
ncbi:hypothetical protein TWF481_009959 [Arthrobotrys musiformis]|uniref:Uncharacterized protein n=1 Tax=Arthrobotrys musiformis TaxID=47236 RepID=A0AAV9W0P4_9PEZI